MPIYEFLCPDCSGRFEELVSSTAPAPACPQCGGPTQRLLSSFATGGRSAARRSTPMPLPAGGGCHGGACGCGR